MWPIIEKILHEKGLNQEQLAKRMHVHSSTISDLKHGRIKKPSFELMCKIADALEVSLDVFREKEE